MGFVTALNRFPTDTHAGWFARFRIQQHHIGYMNRRFELNNAPLSLGTTACLLCFLMFFNQIHARNNDTVLLRLKSLHRPFNISVIAGNHPNFVTNLYTHHNLFQTVADLRTMPSESFTAPPAPATKYG